VGAPRSTAIVLATARWTSGITTNPTPPNSHNLAMAAEVNGMKITPFFAIIGRP
jgi:hypothetical protein